MAPSPHLTVPLLLVLTLPVRAVLAQEPASAPSATSQPTAPTCWLRVTADDVNLRARGDQNSPAVMRVPRGAVLRAAGPEFGWHPVVPPEGVFSFVSAEFVDQRSPTEGVVSVRSGNLRVRTGSLVTDLNPERSDVQTLLPLGATVRILGRSGDWLKIAPPEGVFVYVSAKFVERISDDEARAAQAADAAATRPAPGRPGAGPASAPAEPIDLSGAWGQQLLAIEADIATESRKPALEQNWAGFSARLQPIAAQRVEPAVARLAAGWLNRIGQRIADQAALRAAQDVLRREERERARHTRELEQIERSRQPTTRPGFVAEGLFRRSYVEGAPRFKLENPLTSRVEAYLELAPDAQVRPEDFLGKYVGVRGARRADAALGSDVIRVEALVAIERNPPATQPAGRNP